MRRSTRTANAPMVFRRSPLAQAIAGIVASAGMMAVPTAQAQVIEEIIVTATKRSESTQDVPLAITALSGDFTREANFNDVKDLVAFTPGVSGNSQDSFIDTISVRGIRTQDFGIGGDPSSAFFKNELYEGRNGSAVTSLYDMERSEILRGPQGFLFGRNSIAGAFSVHTAKPEIGGGYSGYIEADVAERDRRAFEGAINLPVSDEFAMRLAGYFSKEDGFVDNLFGGDDLIEHEKWALRWSTAYEADRLRLNTTAEYEDRKQSGSVYRAIETGDIFDTLEAAVGDITLGGKSDQANSDQSLGDNDDAEILTLGAKLEYDFDFATLTSTTGYKDHDYFYTEDYDGTPLNINNYGQDQTGDYFQQELRLTSNGDGPLSWYAGASYYKEDINTLFTFSGSEDLFCQYYGYAYNSGMTFSGCAELYDYYGSPFSPSADGNLTETGRIKGDYSGWATYVDVNYAINEKLDFSVGLRYSDDKKDFTINVPLPDSDLGAYWAYTFATDGDLNGKKSWSDTQTRFVLRYQPSETATFYASYTEGFKSGGFGSFAAVDANGVGVGGETGLTQAGGFRPNLFDPEIVDSYEIGYKDTYADGRAQSSITAFYYTYEDLQVVVFDGGASSVENVADVEGFGLEASLNLVLNDNFDTYIAVSYLDTEAKGLQGICGLENPEGCEGAPLFQAPEFTGAFVLNASFPVARGGEITGRLEASWESERGGGFEQLEETMIDDFVNVGLRVGYRSQQNWLVNLYVENLTNKNTFDGQNNNGGILPSHFFGPLRPRTFGVSATYEWQ